MLDWYLTDYAVKTGNNLRLLHGLRPGSPRAPCASEARPWRGLRKDGENKSTNAAIFMSSRRRDRGVGGDRGGGGGGGGGYEGVVRDARPSRQQQVQQRAQNRDEGAVMSRHQRPPTGSAMLFHAGRPPTGQRPNQPTIAEEPGPPPGRAGAVAIRQQQQGAFPWESKAVRQLAKRVGSRDPGAAPMMVEGREGTILAAVGDQADHQVATEVLKYHQTNRRQAQLADALAQGAGEGIDESGAGPLERVARRDRQEGRQPQTLGRRGDRQLVDKPHPLDRKGAAQRGGGGGGGLGNGRRGAHPNSALAAVRFSAIFLSTK